jgi:phage terminase small subunit
MTTATDTTLDDLIPVDEEEVRAITPKGQKYVDEYMVDMNASRAARAAGYSNLTIPREYAVIVEIERRRKMDARKLKITENRNLKEYARIAYFDPRQLFKEDGSAKEIHELDDNMAACIAGFDYTEEGADKNFRRTFKYKFINKLPALESLSKFLGLFPSEKHEVTGKGGGPIEMAEMSLNDKGRRLAFVLNSALQAKKDTVDVLTEERQGNPTIVNKEI